MLRGLVAAEHAKDVVASWYKREARCPGACIHAREKNVGRLVGIRHTRCTGAAHAMPSLPVATYRVQLRQGFGFDQAGELVPYLSELGISHVYLSPPFRAAPGSTHGYDVTDPNQVDDVLGGEPARQRFLEALAKHGLKHIIDVVPNHMSVATDQNLWWWDVLEKGSSSEHAATFDVQWEGPTEASDQKVLLPILTEHYGRALEARQLQVVREPAGLVLSAMGRRLPLSLESLAPLYSAVARAAGCAKLDFLAGAVAWNGNEQDGERRRKNHAVIQGELSALLATEPQVTLELDKHIEQLNANNEALDELIAGQHYRLAHYRIARYDLDYRRFFDIHDLAALSLHRPSVFDKTHALIMDWVRTGQVDGLRVDHPDGLRDPTGYFKRLSSIREGLWIVAEKILEPGEKLPEDWDVSGTTGYDFLNQVGGLFVDKSAEEAASKLYQQFLGAREPLDFRHEERNAKRFVLDDLLAAELTRLTRLFQRICGSKRRHRDFAQEELRRALREVIACFPVYRTYLHPSSPHRQPDVTYVRKAVRAAAENRPDLDAELLAFVEELLCGNCLSDREWEFVARFQQLSSAAMAKGLEDTAFYRCFRLASLNEVGGDPGRFGNDLEQFHEFCGALQSRWPRTMVTTTTHDTKRSQDARLRISALSELMEAWGGAVQSWSEKASRYRGSAGPDRALEYLFWQTLVAAHPASEERLAAYLEKAMREGKLHTSWLSPNAEYESSVMNFMRGVLADNGIMKSVKEFVDALLPIAWRSSLSETLIELTAVGVPDIYQGAERWDTRLTDPDNRGRIDFQELFRSLERAKRASPEEALSTMADGTPKLWLIHRVLGARKRYPDAFATEATYMPLHAQGAHAERVVAFQRGSRAIVVAPRLWSRILQDGFGDTRISLPPVAFRNVLDNDTRYEGTVEVGRLLSRFPVALLLSEE